MSVRDIFRKRPVIALFLVALYPSIGWAAGREKLEEPPGLYAEHCASCHGKNGEGGKTSPLDSTGHAWHHPDGQIFLWIRNGRYGPAQRMPGFENNLAPREICGLIALMKVWWNADQLESQRKAGESFSGQIFCRK